MGYVLMLAGVILVALAWRPTLALWNRPRPEGHCLSRSAAEELVERLTALQRQVAAMQNDLSHLVEVCADERMRRFTEKPVPEVDEGRREAPDGENGTPSAFTEVLMSAKRQSWSQAVCAAYDAGQDVETIARSLGRGRGEIELILNLWRRR